MQGGLRKCNGVIQERLSSAKVRYRPLRAKQQPSLLARWSCPLILARAGGGISPARFLQDTEHQDASERETKGPWDLAGGMAPEILLLPPRQHLNHYGTIPQMPQSSTPCHFIVAPDPELMEEEENSYSVMHLCLEFTFSPQAIDPLCREEGAHQRVATELLFRGPGVTLTSSEP